VKWGSGRGSEEKKLKKKKWGRKRWSGLDRGFWIGQGRAMRAVAGSKWTVRCASYWVGFARWPCWLGEPDRGVPVGWVHFLYVSHPFFWRKLNASHMCARIRISHI
jgi:hypothetical protein